MKFFYDENPVRGQGDVDFSRLNPTTCYMKHFENSLFLTFMMKNGTFVEKHQASKELAIAERKMKYWKSKADFNEELAMEESIKAKKKWQ